LRELSREEVQEILDARREQLVAVWPDATGDRLDEIVPRHMGREGFRFVAAEDEQGRLAGIAYGYTGAEGQWWHDLVAAAMSEADRTRWLGPGHFEFVELAVRPDLRRRGLGASLHDALLDGLDSPTAVLSTQVDNEAALTLYARRGWRVVVPEIDFGTGQAYCVMGRDLPSGTQARVSA
jgi:ribosomal protein S18 acetylase RimI-like enzyme